MDDYENLDLDELAHRLQVVRERLDVQAAPLRATLAALGPAGLFAVAASEQRYADTVIDRQSRRQHLVAANAAQRLAEQLAFQHRS